MKVVSFFKNRSISLKYCTLLVCLVLIIFLPLPANAGVWDSMAGGVLLGIAWLISGIYYFFFLLAWIASGIMAISLKFFVFEMGKLINDIPSFRVVWTFFRDIANLGFIFILLYAAISTILDKPTQVGKTLAKLIVVAIIINFSFFLVAFVADISNYLGFEIYNSIKVTVTPSDGGPDQVNIETEKLTTAILNTANAVRVDTMNFTNPEDSASGPVNYTGADESEINKGLSAIVKNLFSIILMIVLVFVFLTASVLFIARFLALALAMVISPIMLAAVILPKTENKFYDWVKNKVLAQAFWLPVFMFALYLGLQILADPIFTSYQFVSADGDSSAILILAGHLIKYSIVMAVFLGSLIIAKKMGAAGVDFATKMSGGLMLSSAAWAGRNTAGRAVAWADQRSKDRLTKMAGSSNMFMRGFGSFAQQRIKKAGEKTYDFRNTGIGKKLGDKKFGGIQLGKGTDKTFNKAEGEKQKRINAARKLLKKEDDNDRKEYENTITKETLEADVASAQTNFDNTHEQVEHNLKNDEILNALRDENERLQVEYINSDNNESILEKVQENEKLISEREKQLKSPLSLAQNQLDEAKKLSEMKLEEAKKIKMKEYDERTKKTSRVATFDRSHQKKTVGQKIGNLGPVRYFRNNLDNNIATLESRAQQLEQKELAGIITAAEKRKLAGIRAEIRSSEILRTFFGGRGGFTDDQLKESEGRKSRVIATEKLIKQFRAQLGPLESRKSSLERDLRAAERRGDKVATDTLSATMKVVTDEYDQIKAQLENASYALQSQQIAKQQHRRSIRAAQRTQASWVVQRRLQTPEEESDADKIKKILKEAKEKDNK